MLRSFLPGGDRRRHPRHEAAVDIRVRVELYGFEGEVRPFFASGSTVNISRGGLLAALDAPVSPGSVCNVFFRDVGDRIRPHHVAGHVIRGFEEANRFYVAVAFDEPLLELAVEDLQEAAVSALAER